MTYSAILLSLFLAKAPGTAVAAHITIPQGDSLFRLLMPKPLVLSPIQLAVEKDIDCPGGFTAGVSALYRGDNRWTRLAVYNGFYLSETRPIMELLVDISQKTHNYQDCVLLVNSPTIESEPQEVPTKAALINFPGGPGLFDIKLPLNLPYYAKRLEVIPCLGLRVLELEVFRRTERIQTTRVPGNSEMYELKEPRVFDFIRLVFDANSDVPVCQIQVFVYDRAP